jgi:hypothetical protein
MSDKTFEVASVFDSNYQVETTKEFKDSSSVSSIAYSRKYNTCRVVFKNGREYSYSGVPEEVGSKLLSPDTRSIGKAVNELLIKGAYPAKELKKDQEQE